MLRSAAVNMIHLQSAPIIKSALPTRAAQRLNDLLS
jgi:hypothetical protein